MYFPFHKSQELVSLQALPIFIANDVMKVPNVERDITAYQAHLSGRRWPRERPEKDEYPG